MVRQLLKVKNSKVVHGKRAKHQEHIHSGSPSYHYQSDPKDLQTNLERIPSLCSTFHIGLCNDYPHFDPPDGDKPYDRLPLVRDPTLVRAAQLAIFKLRNVENISVDPQTTKFSLQVFGGIERTLNVHATN